MTEHSYMIPTVIITNASVTLGLGYKGRGEIDCSEEKGWLIKLSAIDKIISMIQEDEGFFLKLKGEQEVKKCRHAQNVNSINQ